METSTERGISASDLKNMIPEIGTLQGIHKVLREGNIPVTRKGNRKLIPSSSVRMALEARGYQYPQKNVAFHVIKGGVGKSSIASAFATRANMYGARVLCIDFDQQGNLTRSLGLNARKLPVWIHVFRGECSVEESIKEVSPGLFLIPSSMNNSRLDVEITSSNTNIRDSIRDILAPIRDSVDLVVFDCPPSLNSITTSVTCASDLVIMPINADDYSMDALNATVYELESISKSYKTTIPYKILWNKYDQREKLAISYLHEVVKNEKFKDNVYPVVVRTDATIKNALAHGQSIFEYKPKAGVCDDIDRLTREFLLSSEDSTNVH